MWQGVIEPNGEASVCYGNRAEITVLVCERTEALSGVLFVPGQELSAMARTLNLSQRAFLFK